MVGRDDIRRIADLQRRVKRVSHDLRVILWDTDDITDLMPMVDKPIANLEQFPVDTCVLLSAKRVRSEQHRVAFTIYNAASAVFSEDMSEAAQREARRLPPLPADAHDRRMGMITLDEDAFNESEMLGYAPEKFMWGDDGSFGVVGTMFRKAPGEPALERVDAVSLAGMPWVDRVPRVEVHGGRLQPDLEDRFDGAWRYVISYAQNIAWCVQHPDQFPIAVSTAASSTHHREHQRLAKREAVDLERVRVVELRPRVRLLREAPTGHHRDFRYSFFVRGHWRHYTDGRVAWVAGYWKAKDKPRLGELVEVERF